MGEIVSGQSRDFALQYGWGVNRQAQATRVVAVDPR